MITRYRIILLGRTKSIPWYPMQNFVIEKERSLAAQKYVLRFSQLEKSDSETDKKNN